MHQSTSTTATHIPYVLHCVADPDTPHWLIAVNWSDVYAAFNLDPSRDEYDMMYDDDLCEMLRACGAPDWVEDRIDCCYVPAAWVVWGGSVTDDQVHGWAMCHPKLAGRTDNEKGMRDRYVAWLSSPEGQMYLIERTSGKV